MKEKVHKLGCRATRPVRVFPKPDECKGETENEVTSASFRFFTGVSAHVFELNSLLSITPVNLKRVSQVIRSDPGLAEQLIRLCNSPIFDLSHQVFTVEEAVVLLGADRLRILVLACHLLEDAGRRLKPGELQPFWRRCSLVALLSEHIARWVRYPHPEQAYLAGLLHDIGAVPLLLTARGKGSSQNAVSGPADSPMKAERKRFGIDHCAMGSRLGAAWNFPLILIDVFEHHHRPEAASQDPLLVGIVAAADRFCQKRAAFHGAREEDAAAPDSRPDGELLRVCLPGLEAEEALRLAEMLDGDFRRLAG